MAAGIKRVALRDYRSIAACDVELQPLALLVGPNGSGKSNFLDALRFLVHSMHAPLEQVLAARSGLRSVLRKLPGGRSAKRFLIEVEFELSPAVSGLYSIVVGEAPDGAAVIEAEHCRTGAHQFTSRPGFVETSEPTTPAFTGDRPALVAFGSLPAFAPVFNLIAGLTFYAPNPERMRPPTPPVPAKVLARDCSNAAGILARIEREQPEIAARLKAYLFSINPEFQDVKVEESGEYFSLTFTPSTNPAQWRMAGADVSDGTLSALGILLAIFQTHLSKMNVSLVGLEEPERNLHPAAAGILLDALLEASLRVPIVASTHSADLLDRGGLPEAALLAVALRDGMTVIGPVDDAGKSILRNRLYTAGELLRNNRLSPAAGVPSR